MGMYSAFAARDAKKRAMQAQTALEDKARAQGSVFDRYLPESTIEGEMRATEPTLQQQAGDWLTGVFDPIVSWANKGQADRAQHEAQLNSPDAWWATQNPQETLGMASNMPAAYAQGYEGTLENAKRAGAGEDVLWNDKQRVYGPALPRPSLAGLQALADTADIALPFAGLVTRAGHATAEIPGELLKNLGEATVQDPSISGKRLGATGVQTRQLLGTLLGNQNIKLPMKSW